MIETAKDFSGQNLRGRSFKGQDLCDAKFLGADYTRVRVAYIAVRLQRVLNIFRAC